MVKLINI